MYGQSCYMDVKPVKLGQSEGSGNVVFENDAENFVDVEKE